MYHDEDLGWDIFFFHKESGKHHLGVVVVAVFL